MATKKRKPKIKAINVLSGITIETGKGKPKRYEAGKTLRPDALDKKTLDSLTKDYHPPVLELVYESETAEGGE